MSQDEWAAVRQAIHEGRYDDARALLQAVDSGVARGYEGLLKVLDDIEQQRFVHLDAALKDVLEHCPKASPLYRQIRQMQDLAWQFRYTEVHGHLLRAMGVEPGPYHEEIQSKLRGAQAGVQAEAPSPSKSFEGKLGIGAAFSAVVVVYMALKIFSAYAKFDGLVALLCAGVMLAVGALGWYVRFYVNRL